MKHTNNNDVSVTDSFITPTEQRLLSSAFSQALWRYDWQINSTPFARPCWHFFIAGSSRLARESCEVELKNHAHWSFLSEIWQRIKSSYLNDATLLGVYANGQTFGQDSPIHRDNRPKEPGRTAVLFCNDFWATAWGGELVFTNNNKDDVIAAILPKPGRLVLFDGQIPYRARSPALDCNQLRITLAFKTITQEPIP